jgi:hypothetical protein
MTRRRPEPIGPASCAYSDKKVFHLANDAAPPLV